MSHWATLLPGNLCTDNYDLYILQIIEVVDKGIRYMSIYYGENIEYSEGRIDVGGVFDPVKKKTPSHRRSFKQFGPASNLRATVARIMPDDNGEGCFICKLHLSFQTF